jgi:hypothetical protein
LKTEEDISFEQIENLVKKLGLLKTELEAYKNRKCSCGKIATIFLCEEHFKEAVV